MKKSTFTNQEFENFKSNVCHDVKYRGELEFIKETLIKKTVEEYWESGSYVFALYLVAMVDYLSKRNDIPLYNGYDYYRKQKLKEPFYPLSAKIQFATARDIELVEKEYLENAIPEFLQYNIVEGDIFNVV